MLYGDHTYPLIVVSILLGIQLLNHYVVHLKLICQLYFIKKKIKDNLFPPSLSPFFGQRKERTNGVHFLRREHRSGFSSAPEPSKGDAGANHFVLCFYMACSSPSTRCPEGQYRSKSETRLKSTFSSLSLWPSATGERGPAWALPGPAPRPFFCCSTPISRQLWPGSDRSAVGNSKSGQARALAEPRVFIQCLLLPGRGGRTLSQSTETTSQAVEQVAIYSCQRESKQQLFSHQLGL